MEGQWGLGRSVTLGEFWSQKWDEVGHQGGSRSKAVLWHWGKGSLWREMILLRLFFLCMGLDSRRKHHFTIVFFSLLGSNFSSCCPAPAAPKKPPARTLGWHHCKEGLGRAL